LDDPGGACSRIVADQQPPAMDMARRAAADSEPVPAIASSSAILPEPIRHARALPDAQPDWIFRFIGAQFVRVPAGALPERTGMMWMLCGSSSSQAV
jgi:hypothetical protein